MKWARSLQPFASRNYRTYLVGQLVSLTGTMMTQTTSLWLVYHLTHSSLLPCLKAFMA